jgi:hypothetical protein
MLIVQATDCTLYSQPMTSMMKQGSPVMPMKTLTTHPVTPKVYSNPGTTRSS